MPVPDSSTKIQDGELLAAVDLGSNSFHMVVARYQLGELRVIDRLSQNTVDAYSTKVTGFNAVDETGWGLGRCQLNLLSFK